MQIDTHTYHDWQIETYANQPKEQPMNIAIDLDGTLDRDPELWRMFIGLCQQRGHRVVCVTARSVDDAEEAVEPWMASKHLMLPVYYTDRQSKTDYMASRDVKIDIWIDDDPKRCALGH
jgi:hypothetical protein